MKIHLHAEVRSGLGEDTFWTWAKREFDNSVWFGDEPQEEGDVVLQYSTLGKAPEGPAKSIALCWELYPEMERQLGYNADWAAKTKRTRDCARACDYRVAASELVVKDYEMCGQVDVLPIGINGDLFKPMYMKDLLRLEYGIPVDRPAGIWCGTKHEMKGFDRIVNHAKNNPDVFWIIIWKSRSEQAVCTFEGQTRVHATQETYAKLLNCADFYACCGKLEPFFMCEWEAMACDVPLLDLSGMTKDFVPSKHPRQDLIKKGWLRKDAKKLWMNYIKKVSEA